MKTLTILSVVALFLAELAFAGNRGRFPENPDPVFTPGALCERADTYRYPEHIPYCNRDVESETKWMIIDRYDRERGFEIRPRRTDFKIDHYIPLCMGGSNDEENLWPQHKTIYEKTDPLEEKLCRLMSLGRMKQTEAVDLIRKVKNDLSIVDAVHSQINARLNQK